MAQAAGFQALYLGGGALGYLKCVLEANLSLHDVVDAGLDIMVACDLPLIMDAAAGYGDPMHIERTVRTAEQAGFAAIEIEDQVLPKRAHHHVGVDHIEMNSKAGPGGPALTRSAGMTRASSSRLIRR